MKLFLEKSAEQWINIIPKVHPCKTLKDEGRAHAIFYDGIGKTRVFAWIALPPKASKKHPVPGMVLVHGGLGTAFSKWANYWAKQGYAAIAMDTCGAMPLPNDKNPKVPGKWPRHKWSGAAGWGAFEQWDLPPEEQWFSHAEGAIMLGHNLLASMPEVDADRIGITGVSWGAVLTLIAAGLDPRYKAASPIYGNGFLWKNEGNKAFTILKKESADALKWWVQQWDPANFLKKIKMPVHWLASSNDNSIFYPEEWQASTDLVSSSERCIKLRLIHSHGKYSENQLETLAFFNQYLKDGPVRPTITKTRLTGDKISASYSGEKPLGTFLIMTADPDPNWFLREWHVLPATLKNGLLSAELPSGWKSAYLNVITKDLQEFTSGLVFNSKGTK